MSTAFMCLLVLVVTTAAVVVVLNKIVRKKLADGTIKTYVYAR
jgi:hypothetical protein